MTDYKTVKAWFQQCRDGAAAVKAQKQKIQRIRDAAEKCTQSLNGMPTGGSSGDKVGDAVARLDAEERELKQMEQRLALLKMNATCRAYTGAVDPETVRQTASGCFTSRTSTSPPSWKLWGCAKIPRSQRSSAGAVSGWLCSGIHWNDSTSHPSCIHVQNTPFVIF